MLRTLIAISLVALPLPAALAGAAVASDPVSKGKCQAGASKKRKALGGFLGGMAGNVLGRTGFGTVGGVLPTSQLLTEALIAILDCKEQQQAAAATNEAVRGGVGSSAAWTSESRENVSGSSSVTGEETLADGSQCLTVTDVVIVDGEETSAPKRMCRKPGASGYARV